MNNRRSQVTEQDLINEMLTACQGRTAKLKKISNDIYSVHIHGPDIQGVVTDIEYTVDKQLFFKFRDQLKEKK